MPANHIAQHPGRLDRLQSAMEVHGGSYVAMAEEPPNGLVVARVVFHVNSRGGMSILVQSDAQTRHFSNSICDLDAEQMRVFRSSVCPGEQPVLVGVAHYGWTKVVHTFIDYGRHMLVQ